MTLPKSILIVEDEMLTQRYLKDILTGYGIEHIMCARNDKEALSYTETTHYDMVFMDINLKNSINGIQLSKSILSQQNVPIIFVTAYSDDATVDESLALYPYGYIVKPFTKEEIKVSMLVAYQMFLSYNEEKTLTIPNVIHLTENLKYSMEDYCFIGTRHNEIITLPLKQNMLIRLLCRNLNNIVSNEALIQYIWDTKDSTGSLLRTLVYNIRKTFPELRIVSHHKIGYSIHQVGYGVKNINVSKTKGQKE